MSDAYYQNVWGWKYARYASETETGGGKRRKYLAFNNVMLTPGRLPHCHRCEKLTLSICRIVICGISWFPINLKISSKDSKLVQSINKVNDIILLEFDWHIKKVCISLLFYYSNARKMYYEKYSITVHSTVTRADIFFESSFYSKLLSNQSYVFFKYLDICRIVIILC